MPNFAKKCQAVKPISLAGEVLVWAVGEGWRGPEAEPQVAVDLGASKSRLPPLPNQAGTNLMTPVPGTQSAPPSHLTDGKLSLLVGTDTRPQPSSSQASVTSRMTGSLQAEFCVPGLCFFRHGASNFCFSPFFPIGFVVFCFPGWAGMVACLVISPLPPS